MTNRSDDRVNDRFVSFEVGLSRLYCELFRGMCSLASVPHQETTIQGVSICESVRTF